MDSPLAKHPRSVTEVGKSATIIWHNYFYFLLRIWGDVLPRDRGGRTRGGVVCQCSCDRAARALVYRSCLKYFFKKRNENWITHWVGLSQCLKRILKPPALDSQTRRGQKPSPSVAMKVIIFYSLYGAH